MTSTPLWMPTSEQVAQAEMTRFMEHVASRFGESFSDSRDLHGWSTREPEAFWGSVWDFFGIVGEKGERILDGREMPGARFFPGAQLNFAENLLRKRGREDAIIFRGEDKAELRWSWDELRAHVSRLQQALKAAGVEAGDRVAGLLPNRPESVAAMLAAASIGAVWSSASPDFGVRGVLDRFGQIEPKVLFACDGYWYAGKRIGIGEKLGEIARQLPSVSMIVLVDYLGEAEVLAGSLPKAEAFSGFQARHEAREIEFTRLPFDHPLYILFSSGTTGAPKCIVHRAGGVLLQHLKEHGLHGDVRDGDRLFYFTTLGWMMWNWLVSGLARGATLMLYDGSPFHPVPTVLFDYAAEERITHLGVSAKWIDAVKKAELRPVETHDLSSLRTIFSTGSPLVPEGFDFVYEAIKPGVHLASMSGGTDLVACFVIGDFTQPVWRGEIQGPALGMATEIWREDGSPAPVGEKGELVCTLPFPTMPLKFWNDPGEVKYRAAYFERFPGVWCHGDFAELTEHGGFIIHGRSDATLNPGGVRIGTAEIYAQVEGMPEIQEALCIGQSFDGDTRVVLFVRMQEGRQLDEALEKAIRARIRVGASPRHVPAKIVPIADIPRTKSGKITELAVRDIVHGREVKNKEALANPEALELFRDLPALRS